MPWLLLIVDMEIFFLIGIIYIKYVNTHVNLSY